MKRKIFLILILLAFGLLEIAFAQSVITDLVGKLYKLADSLYNIGIVLAAIGIIIGSYLFLSAAGDTNKIDTGKRAILWSIAAAVLMSLSKVIVKFIESQIK